MADHDEEDLFADLYDGDEAAPDTAPAPKTTSAIPEQAESIQYSTESAPATGLVANGSNGAPAQPEDDQDQGYDNYGQEMQGQELQGDQDYNYNQGNDYGNPPQVEQPQEEYKPIGIKEDG